MVIVVAVSTAGKAVKDLQWPARKDFMVLAKRSMNILLYVYMYTAIMITCIHDTVHV